MYRMQKRSSTAGENQSSPVAMARKFQLVLTQCLILLDGIMLIRFESAKPHQASNGKKLYRLHNQMILKNWLKTVFHAQVSAFRVSHGNGISRPATADFWSLVELIIRRGKKVHVPEVTKNSPDRSQLADPCKVARRSRKKSLPNRIWLTNDLCAVIALRVYARCISLLPVSILMQDHDWPQKFFCRQIFQPLVCLEKINNRCSLFSTTCAMIGECEWTLWTCVQKFS